MKIAVDRDTCQSYGQCALAAQDVFHLTDDAVLEYDPDPDDSRRATVEEAADLCPVQAILLDPV